MNKLNNLIFLFAVIIFNSCSIKQLRRLDNPPPKEKIIRTLRQSDACEVKDINFYSELETLNNIVGEVVLNTTSIKGLKEKLAETLIYQALLRPDIASPSARIQIVGKLKKKSIYIDFIPKDEESNPLASALEWLTPRPRQLVKSVLKNLKSESVRKLLKVDKGLETFIANNRGVIDGDIEKKLVFKIGSDSLIAGETLKYSDTTIRQISTLLLQKENDPIIENKLYTYTNKSRLTLSCNQNLALFDQSLYFSLPEVSSLHSLLISKDEHIMAIVSQDTSKIKNVEETPFFRGLKAMRPTSICFSNTATFAVSSSRDPGQLMHHFLNKFYISKDAQNSHQHLDSARHLLMIEPTRLFLESEKADEELLNKLQRMEIPILHRHRIGKFWITTQDKNNSKVYLDGRFPTYGICEPNNP